MNKEIIEKYIQFAIENWFIHNHMINIKTIAKYWDINNPDKLDRYTLYWLFQTKEFIEAIARWLHLWDNLIRVKIDSIFNKLIDDITFGQAKAIRDWTLEKFILLIIK